MNENNFLNEIKNNTLDELELIYSTQKDLYTEEEMEVINKRINYLKGEIEAEKEERIKKLRETVPKEIECPKCSGPNPFENNECCFCGYNLEKAKNDFLMKREIEYENYYEDDDCDAYDNDEEYDGSETKSSFTFQYVISFIIPLVGYILGAIMLSKDTYEERQVGKCCIIIGIVSSILMATITILVNYI